MRKNECLLIARETSFETIRVLCYPEHLKKCDNGEMYSTIYYEHWNKEQAMVKKEVITIKRLQKRANTRVW